MAAPNCAATAGSIIPPVDGAVVSVGDADCDAGGSGLAELRAATGVEVLINLFTLFILFNESLMKLTSSPFPTMLLGLSIRGSSAWHRGSSVDARRSRLEETAELLLRRSS